MKQQDPAQRSVVPTPRPFGPTVSTETIMPHESLSQPHTALNTSIIPTYRWEGPAKDTAAVWQVTI